MIPGTINLRRRVLRKTKICGLLAVLVVGLLGINFDSCSGMGPAIGKQCDKWIKTFYRIPRQDQSENFRSFKIEDKYSIFICGNQIVHPPAIYLARAFAMDGNTAADFLKAKLSQAKDDLTIRDIILVFREMSRQKTCDVAGDTVLMQCITDSVTRIKNEGWRNIVDQMVKEIKQDAAADSRRR
jgi:hypothetical protein